LLDRGAKIDSVNGDGFTALHIAARKGHVSVIKELLDHGAKIDLAEEDGFTALHTASLKGHVSVNKELLDRGAKTDSVTGKGNTALYIAAQEGHVSVIKELLDHGAKIDLAEEDGITALQSAALNIQVSVIKELLDCGAKIDLAEENGLTALHIATLLGHVSVIKELLDRGAKIDLVQKNGATALEFAESSHNVSVIELFAQACKKRMDCGQHICQLTIGNVHDHSTCNHKVQYIFPARKHKSEKQKRCMEPMTWKCNQPCIKFMDCGKHQCECVCGSNHTHSNCMKMVRYTFPGCNHPSQKRKGCTEAIIWKCVDSVKSTVKCGHEVSHKCHQVKGECRICVPKPCTRSELGSSNTEYVMVKDMVEKYIQSMHNWTPTVRKVLKVTNSKLEEKFETAKSKAVDKHVDWKFLGTTDAGVLEITESGFRNLIYKKNVFYLFSLA
jgi:hypothetical protein